MCTWSGRAKGQLLCVSDWSNSSSEAGDSAASHPRPCSPLLMRRTRAASATRAKVAFFPPKSDERASAFRSWFAAPRARSPDDPKSRKPGKSRRYAIAADRVLTTKTRRSRSFARRTRQTTFWDWVASEMLDCACAERALGLRETQWLTSVARPSRFEANQRYSRMPRHGMALRVSAVELSRSVCATVSCVSRTETRASPEWGWCRGIW